jgi:hypothetical protein
VSLYCCNEDKTNSNPEREGPSLGELILGVVFLPRRLSESQAHTEGLAWLRLRDAGGPIDLV